MKRSDFVKLIREELITSSYEILSENVNPSNHYDFEHTRKNLWEFNDKKGIKQFIILHQSLYKGDTKAEIKFGWVDDKGVKRYDKPPTYDEKIFNTIIYILTEEIIKQYKQYFEEFYLEATDLLRYRLYRQVLNKFINKDEFDIIEKPESNTLILKTL